MIDENKIISKSSFNRVALLVFKLILILLISILACYKKPDLIWLFASLGFLISLALILIPRESTLLLNKIELKVTEHSYFKLRSKTFKYQIANLKEVKFSGRKAKFNSGIGLHNLAIEVMFPSMGSYIHIELKDKSKYKHPCFAERTSLRRLLNKLKINHLVSS